MTTYQLILPNIIKEGLSCLGEFLATEIVLKMIKNAFLTLSFPVTPYGVTGFRIL